MFKASPAISSKPETPNLNFNSPEAAAPLNESWPASLDKPYIDSGFCAVKIFCSTVASSM